MSYQQDIAWKRAAHARGSSTNLDGIPNWMLRLVHLAWWMQDRVGAA